MKPFISKSNNIHLFSIGISFSFNSLLKSYFSRISFSLSSNHVLVVNYLNNKYV